MDDQAHGVWKRLPFARIFIFFFTGIVIDRFIAFPFQACLTVTSVLCTLLAIFYLLPLSYTWRLSNIRGMFLLLAMVLLGALSNAIVNQKTKGQTAAQTPYTLLQIEEGPKSTSKTKRYIATIVGIQEKKISNTATCYLYINNETQKIFEKDQVLITLEKPKVLLSTSNPGAFDFSKFSHQQNITHTLYLQHAYQWVLLGHTKEREKTFIEKMREDILLALRNSIKDSIHIGLAEAMLIGYRDDLNKALLSAYVDTGVVHVIAISGLHLGLIFMLIDLGIRTLFGKKKSLYAGILITIPLLWGFAILTGLSPSVNRSALMFSVLILGRAISKRNNSLNALFASAFLLLYHNPKLITDIGFQLSYSAVGSILLFERGINKMVYLNNKIARYVWSMISITIAAQLLTTPLVIYHFHRFPILFLFANLVAIPLSSMILVLEIFLCLMYLMNLKVGLLVAIIELMMDWMNGYIKSISKIPFAMIDDLYFSTPHLLILCVLFTSFAWLLIHPSRKLYYSTVGILLLLCLVRSHEARILQARKRVVILNLQQASAVAIQYGKNGMIAISENQLQNPQFLQKLIKETGYATGVNYWQISTLPRGSCIIEILPEGEIAEKKEKVNKIVLLLGNPNLTLKEMTINKNNTKKIIPDGSNKLWKIREWEKEAYSLHLPLHSTAEKGPCIIDLR